MSTTIINPEAGSHDEALAAIDRLISDARGEIWRLTKIVKFNADDLRADAADVKTGLGFRWRHTEDQVALHDARVRLSALNDAWDQVARLRGSEQPTKDRP